MATFVNDTFSTGTSGTQINARTGETGATWTYFTGVTFLSGQITIGNPTGSIRSNTFDSALCAYASGTPASAEYDLTGSMVWPSGTQDGTRGGLVGRLDTAAEAFYRTIVSVAGSDFNAIEFTRRLSGSNTDLGTAFVANWTNATPLPLLLEVRNASKKVYWNGSLQLSTTDNAVTGAGKVGIAMMTNGGIAPSDTQSIRMTTFTAADPVLPTPALFPRYRSTYRGLVMR
jgi:hypothetical protein